MKTPMYVRKPLSDEEIAILWGIRRSAVRVWRESGALQLSHQGTVTRDELLRFVESTEGRALIAAARQ